MKSGKSPALATWLLQHLSLGKNEALAGDLLEEFAHGRSAVWYWRQVIVAIWMAFRNEIHAEWTSGGKAVIWTFGFAVVWYCVVSEYWNYIDLVLRRIAIASWFVMPGWGALLAYPSVSLSFMLAAGLSIYLTLRRGLNLKKFARGWFVGLLLLELEDIAWRIISPMYGLKLWRILAFLYTWFSWVPLFAAVLLSIWIAQPGWTQSDRSQPSPDITA